MPSRNGTFEPFFYETVPLFWFSLFLPPLSGFWPFYNTFAVKVSIHCFNTPILYPDAVSGHSLYPWSRTYLFWGKWRNQFWRHGNDVTCSSSLWAPGTWDSSLYLWWTLAPLSSWWKIQALLIIIYQKKSSYLKWRINSQVPVSFYALIKSINVR